MSMFMSVLNLSWQLFRGTIGAKYRRSFLGYVWMVFPAIAITGGISLASQSGVIRPGQTSLPYPLFVFVGVLIWQVFVDAVDVSHKAVDGARSYLTKVNCAREAIVLAQLYETLIIAAVRLALLVLLVVFFGGGEWRAFAVLALCFAGTVVFGLGTGALLMPFTILFADLQHGVRVVLTYGIFLTPAFYAPEGSGVFARLIQCSPLAPLMDSARDAAAGMAISQPGFFVAILGTSIVVLVMGFLMVRVSAPILVERMLIGGR
jgi:lipopolysaccharide transport system permease protein